MDDLTAFLCARLDEDETWSKDWTKRAESMGGSAHWMEGRVLREVGAKRAILASCEAVIAADEFQDVPGIKSGVHLAWQILYSMAAVYSDHLDYRQEWMA